jgi:hypothetical protein
MIAVGMVLCWISWDFSWDGFGLDPVGLAYGM